MSPIRLCCCTGLFFHCFSHIAYGSLVFSAHQLLFVVLPTGFDLSYFKRSASAVRNVKLKRYKSLSAGHSSDGLGELKYAGLAQNMIGII